MLEKLAKQTAIYGISTIVVRFLSYLLSPFYTWWLSREEYGVITDIYALIPFALVVLTMGMESSYFRFAGRADEAGGSTLGNLQSHTLPIPMADIGCAQFAMHSAVETASVADAEAMTKAVAAFYRVHLRALGDGTYTLE